MHAPVLLGATGRVGRLILAGWDRAGPAPDAAPPPVALGRGPGAALRWDMAAPPPALPGGARPGVVFHFAGVTPAGAGDLAANAALGRAGFDAAAGWGAAHVFVASSATVYGRPEGPAAEDAPARPETAYGRSMLAREQALLERAARPGAPGLTLLRIGNVAGACEPFLSAARQAGPLDLDIFADGTGPRRCYIGPLGLARCLAALARLAARGHPLPRLLNLAAAAPAGMDELLDAMDKPWRPRPAPASALQELLLDTSRLETLCPGAAGRGTPEELLAELAATGQALGAAPP